MRVKTAEKQDMDLSNRAHLKIEIRDRLVKNLIEELS